MKIGSLFSGIGGFDLGFERAGLQGLFQVEIDKDCNRVLPKHWPNVERFEDVSKLSKLPAVDVLCGGFPCQDLSVAGRRKGLAGERSGLWFEFLRIAQINTPRTIVIENVPGLLSSDEHRDFAIVLRGLVECGYCLAWRVLDAQFYRVAQRRRRVFIVGSLGSGRCAQILFESESVSWNPPTRREARQRTTNPIKASAPNRRNGGSSPPNGDEFVISGAVSSKWAKGSGGPAGDEAYNLVIPIQEVGARESKNQNGVGIGIGKDSDVMYTLQSGQVHGVGAVTHALRSEAADASEDGTGRGTPLIVDWPADVSPPLDGSWAYRMPGSTNQEWTSQKGGRFVPGPIAFSSKDHGADAGEISPTLRSQNFKDSHMNGGGQVAIAFTERGREGGANLEIQENLSYALRDPQKGMNSRNSIAGSFGVRRLTPRECERLQGFPDDFTRWDSDGKEISDSARYRMLGNAVAVPVAEWIGRRILAA